MKMQPREIIETCSRHYQTWKEEVFRAETRDELERYLRKAFFWLELQNNLLMLWTIEKTMGDDPEIKKKIEKAQLNVNKKITEYASEVLQNLR